jgi:hypothetical protein
MSWFSKLFGGSSASGISCSKCGRGLTAFSTSSRITVASPDQLRGKALQCAKCGKICCSDCLATIPPGMQGCPHCNSMAMRPYSGS